MVLLRLDCHSCTRHTRESVAATGRFTFTCAPPLPSLCGCASRPLRQNPSPSPHACLESTTTALIATTPLTTAGGACRPAICIRYCLDPAHSLTTREAPTASILPPSGASSLTSHSCLLRPAIPPATCANKQHKNQIPTLGSLPEAFPSPASLPYRTSDPSCLSLSQSVQNSLSIDDQSHPLPQTACKHFASVATGRSSVQQRCRERH